MFFEKLKKKKKEEKKSMKYFCKLLLKVCINRLFFFSFIKIGNITRETISND